MIFSYTYINNSLPGTSGRFGVQQGVGAANFIPQRVTKLMRVEITGVLTAGGTVQTQLGTRPLNTAGNNPGVQIDGVGAVPECYGSGSNTAIGAVPFILANYAVPAANIFTPFVIDLSNIIFPAGGLPSLFNMSLGALAGSIAINIFWQELAL